MSRFKKIVFILFVVISIALAYLGYHALKNIKQPSVKAITLIPDGCELFMSFEDYPEFSDNLRNKNLLWEDLQGIAQLNSFEKHLHYFDSLCSTDENLNALVNDNPIHYALYPGKKFLIACNLKELSAQNITRETLDKLSNSLALLALKAEVNDGVVGISNSEELLKNLFDRNKNSILQNPDYKKLDDLTNYSGNSLFINHQIKGSVFKNTFSDINIKPDKIILNGVKLIDSLEFLGDPAVEPISRFEFLEKIPLISNAFEVFAIGNAEKLFNTESAETFWSDVNEEALFNAKQQFYDQLDRYLVKVLMPSKKHALLLNLSDTSKINELIPFMKDTNETRSNGIVKLRNGHLFAASTFKKLKLNELNYCFVMSDHLVFTENYSDAEIFKNAETNKSSILDNKRFRNFATKNFDSEYHYLSYQLINSLSKEEIPFSEYLGNTDIAAFKNIGNCSFMSLYKKDVINYRFNLGYSQENFSDEPNVLWTMKTDSNIITQPFVFKNHITGGNEIVFQDAANQIYLQNVTGKTLWKKKLNEKIESEIFTVDAFKNGKYQMLFNSKNYIHLIDRNGNYVEGYPVKLPRSATNKLSINYYENKSDPRLFIACADHKIYNYSIWGIKQEGYRPLQVNDDVVLPIKYCRVGLSDYLITADVSGKIYVFSRKGDGRIDFTNKLVDDVENFEIIAGNSLSNTQILYFDKKNNLLEKVSFADKKEIHKLFEGENLPAYCFYDFDGNKISDVIVSNSNHIEIYDFNGTKIFTDQLSDNTLVSAVNYYSFIGASYLNVFDQTNSNLIIKNVEQRSIKEYKATLPAQVYNLFNDGKGYVIIAYNNELKCVKL